MDIAVAIILLIIAILSMKRVIVHRTEVGRPQPTRSSIHFKKGIISLFVSYGIGSMVSLGVVDGGLLVYIILFLILYSIYHLFAALFTIGK